MYLKYRYDLGDDLPNLIEKGDFLGKGNCYKDV